MGKNCAGRLAGHHITPGQGWRWQKFGDRLMLVTDGGGADVVLSIRGAGHGASALATCGRDGVMQPLSPDHPLAVVLAELPAMVDLLRDLRDRNDRPRQLPQIEALLERAGLGA